MMSRSDMIAMWEAIFAVGKGITYLLLMAALIKYIVS
jgi:hypothetical protein